MAVFAKPPRPGEVKTRLAEDIGDEAAAELAHALLRDAWRAARRFTGIEPVVASTEPLTSDLIEPDATVWLQGDGHLGRRIERILRLGLEHAPIAVAVGADVPELPAAHVERALEALEQSDVDAVLGPADDGGFCLLAVRRCPDGLLDGIPWSTTRTGEITRQRLEDAGLETLLLPAWFDIDDLLDLARLAECISEGTVAAPATAHTLAQLDRRRIDASGRRLLPRRTGISVVVPTLNEAERIGALVASLCATPGIDEILVVDGGSTDATPEIVERMLDRHSGLRLLVSKPGRASQMNRGADLARGETLLFLHADTRLPDDAVATIERVLAKDGIAAGAFRTWTVDDTGQNRLGPLLHLADVRSRYTSLPYGDQALFMRAATFRAVGGFPDMPLMEDLELSMRLARLGAVETARSSVRVSGRRFIARPIWYTFLVNVYPLLYRLGVSPETLARLYAAVR